MALLDVALERLKMRLRDDLKLLKYTGNVDIHCKDGIPTGYHLHPYKSLDINHLQKSVDK